MMKSVLKALYLRIRKTLFDMLGIFLTQKNATLSLKNIKHILFIRIDRIGDIVLSTPAIRSIKEHLPSATLTVLASRENHSILDHNPFVDKVHIYEKKHFFKKWIMWFRLRQSRFDLTIDPILDYAVESSLLSFFSGAEKRVGYSAYGREAFYSNPVEPPREPMHMACVVSNILHHVGIPARSSRPELYLSDDEIKRAHEWLDYHHLSGNRPIVAIHPGAHYESQKWPLDYYSILVKRLQESNVYTPLIFGAPADGSAIERIVQQHHNRISYCISENLRDFTSLLSCCHALICNNSGPLHMATALNIPTISFMGPTEREKWSPVGHRNIVLRMDNLSCIGCNLSYCKIKTHDCMRLITPDMVVESIREMLKRER